MILTKKKLKEKGISRLRMRALKITKKVPSFLMSSDFQIMKGDA